MNTSVEWCRDEVKAPCAFVVVVDADFVDFTGLGRAGRSLVVRDGTFLSQRL